MATKRRVSTPKEADLKGKRVFVSVDLNVPLDENFYITDGTRVSAAVPTVKYLMLCGAKVILSSHWGRPKGKYSLKPLVPRLSELLGVEVKMANDCIMEEIEKSVAQLPEGGVLLLENVRFYEEEEKNDPEFVKKLASLADLHVNDAFGTAHRAHASTEGVAKYLNLKLSVAEFLMLKELDYLVGAGANPKRPVTAIYGWSKAYYEAQGHPVGSSLVEEAQPHLATSLLEKAKAKGVSLLLPMVVADTFAPDADSKVVPASGIPDGWMGLDIGRDSIKTFNKARDHTQTIIWNGPMSVFEFDKFAKGTEDQSELEQGEVAAQNEGGAKDQDLASLELSMAIAEGLTVKRTLKMKGTTHGREVMVLIDCGATHNFVSNELVKDLQISTVRVKNYAITVGDGRKTVSNLKCPEIVLEIQGLEIKQPFYPFSLGNNDLVLGVEWLESLGETRMNWSELYMKIQVGPRWVCLKGDPAFTKSPGNLTSIKKEIQAVGVGYSLELRVVETEDESFAAQV